MRRLAVAGLLVACASPQRATLDLRRDAASAFDACDEDAVLDAAALHGLQLALAPCGHNRITQAAWSPDGRLLLLRFGDASVVMDPRTRRLPRLAVPEAVGDAVWVGPRRLAIPVVGSSSEGALRIAEVDVGDDGVASAVYLADVPWSGVGLGLVGRLPDGRWWGLRTDTLDPASPADESTGWVWSPGASATAWPTAEPVRGASLGPGGREAVVADGEGLSVVDVATGGTLRRWEGAAEGALDASGRWVLASVPTETEIGRKRAVRPDLWVFERGGPGRWRLDGLHGDHPAWYPGAGGWITWRLWGLADTPLRRNVALLDAGDRLAALAAGQTPWGVTAVP